MNRLFEGVIWPAVAGNVAWAFFYVLVTEPLTGPVLVRLVMLVALAVYLMAAWMRQRNEGMRGSYYALDTVFAISVVLLAIATSGAVSAASWWAGAGLIGALSSSALGHLCNVWDVNREVGERRFLAGANGVGLIIVVTGQLFGTEPLLAHFAAMGLALLMLAMRWTPTPEAPDSEPPKD